MSRAELQELRTRLAVSEAKLVEKENQLQKSQASRDKLRTTLNLLKEKSLNITELLHQHKLVQSKLAEATQRAEQEQAGREAAEESLAAIRRENEGMLAELQAIRRQLGQTDRCAELAKTDAAKAQAKADVLQRQVAALEAQVNSIGQVLQQLTQQCAGQPMTTRVEAPVPKHPKPVADDAVLHALSAGLSELQDEHKSLQGKVLQWDAQLAGKLQQLSGDVQEARGLAQRGSGDMQRAKDQVEHLGGEVQHVRGQVQQALGQVERCSAEVQQALGLVRRYSGEVRLVEGQLQSWRLLFARLATAGPLALEANQAVASGRHGGAAEHLEPAQQLQLGSPRQAADLARQGDKTGTRAVAAPASPLGAPAGSPTAQRPFSPRRKAAGSAAAGNARTAIFTPGGGQPGGDGALQAHLPAEAATEVVGAAPTAAAGMVQDWATVRQRAAVALVKASEEQPGPAVPAARRKSPTRRQRPAIGAQRAQQPQRQQAKHGRAGAAGGPPGKRVRYQEPPPAAAATHNPAAAPGGGVPAKPQLIPPVRGALLGRVPPAAALPTPASAAARPDEELGAGAAVASPRTEPSLAVSAIGLVEEEPVAERVHWQLCALWEERPSMQVVRSVAADLAQAVLQEGFQIELVRAQFISKLLDCAALQPRLGAVQPNSLLKLAAPSAEQWPSSQPTTLAVVGLPPHMWFQWAQQQSTCKVELKACPGQGTSPHPYIAVWCQESALGGHTLRWLLHCALQLDAELASRSTVQQDGAGSPAEAVARHPPGGFCQGLRAELHRRVVEDCLTKAAGAAGGGRGGGGKRGGVGQAQPDERANGPGTHGLEQVFQAAPGPLAETELCAAAAAVAGLCRLDGQVQALRALVHDLLSIQPAPSELLLPPLAAALEIWPEALAGLASETHLLQPGSPLAIAPAAAAAADEVAAPNKEASQMFCSLASVHARLQQLYYQVIAKQAGPPGSDAVAPPAVAESRPHGDLIPMPGSSHVAAFCLHHLGLGWWGWPEQLGNPHGHVLEKPPRAAEEPAETRSELAAAAAVVAAAVTDAQEAAAQAGDVGKVERAEAAAAMDVENS
ncbi:hypothetical protein N2152v2_003870 [Parachlorella kessleri]